ncbi:peptidase S8/S53 domain-containing protein [Syncephalis plumigaleata]|nr:peptidase S8/S53 domain-containing protein [Syncephalis plumigaleata]
MNLSRKLFAISTILLVFAGKSLATPAQHAASSGRFADQPRLRTRGVNESTTTVNDPASVWIDAVNTYIVEFDLSSGITTENALNNFRNQLVTSNITYTERYNFNTVIKGVSIQTTRDQYRQLNDIGVVKRVWPVHTAVSSPVIVTTNNYNNINQLAVVHGTTGVTDAQKKLKLNGSNIKVGVVDSGVDYRHPHSVDVLAPVVVSRVPVADNDPLDTCSGHGTHVAGIIGANDMLVTGVAPNVIFGAYRITSCNGQTYSDITVAGMERAYRDGMDIVNLSMLSDNPWPTFTTSLAVERLVALGVYVVGATGNSGTFGLWLQSAPAAAPNAMSAASAESQQYMATVLTASTDPDRVVEYVSAKPGAPINITEMNIAIAQSTYEVSGASKDSACAPLAGNYTNQIVLAKRGGCTFNTKALNAQNAGAHAIVVYDLTEEIAAPLVDDPTVTIPTASIANSNGQTLVANIQANGTAVNITFASEPRLSENPYGGSISVFSSWGPTPYLNFKPDITAPGGKIYSTWLTNNGGYATLSGTSMSSPYIAGAMALYLQYKGKAQTTAAKMRDAFLNSAKPIVYAKGDRLYASTTRQGSGFVNVYRALTGFTRVSPSRFALNDTQHAGDTNMFGIKRSFTVYNDGSVTRAYKITHRPAKSVLSLEANGTAAAQPTLSNETASALYFPPLIILRPGDSYTVDMTIIPPLRLPSSERWIYSGYIIADPKPFPSILIPNGVVSENAVYIPYMGMKGNMYDIRPLKSKVNYVKLVNLRDWTPVPPDQKGSYRLAETDYPMMFIHIEFPIRQIYVYIYDAATGERVGLLPDATTSDYARNDNDSFPEAYMVWYGSVQSLTDGTVQPVKNGEYFLRLAALRPYGNANNEADYDFIQTQNMIINRY